MEPAIEVKIALEELQHRILAIDVFLAKAELLVTQLESGEKSAFVIPSILTHIESARKIAALPTGINQ